MDEPFELPVTYKGEELLFPAQLHLLGYTHQFRVGVYGVEVFFEPDESGEYRALIDPSLIDNNHKIDIALLQAIAHGILAIT